MDDLKWTDREKKIARRVSEVALAEELASTLAEFKARAAAVAEPEDMWALEQYLRDRRHDIDRKYDYRYSQLIWVFGRLLLEGRIREEQLAGLSEEKARSHSTVGRPLVRVCGGNVTITVAGNELPMEQASEQQRATPKTRGDPRPSWLAANERAAYSRSIPIHPGGMHPMRTLIVLSTSLLLLLGGCANLQGMKVAAPPESLKGRGIVHSGQAAADVKIAPNAYRIGDGTFVAQSAGGSAAVGLLFGVVGALVNTATISAESERVRDAVSPGSVARLEPATEFARAWKESGLPDAVDPQAARIESFVIFYLDNAREKVHVVPGLRVSGPGLKAADGASEWVGHYLLATERALLPKKLNEPLSPEELVEHSSTLRAAYGELLKEVALDLRSGPAPRRMVANINAPALKATVMGFAGFTSGDVDMAPDGRLAMRVNIENYGPAMTRANPYFVWVFPTGKQYSFEVGPEERRSSP